MSVVTYESSGHIGIITLNRPAALNALNSQVLEALKTTFHQVDRQSVRCLILTGAGQKAFAAGADVAEISRFTQQQGKQFSEMGNDILLAIERFPIPVIAAVHGYALGGGCELALCCDIRLCSEQAVFGLPEVSLGILPGFGGTQRLRRLVGTGQAKEMIYTAVAINAEEACRIGLVNQVYPAGDLMAKARDLAGRIAANAPGAVQAAKTAVNKGRDLNLPAAVKEESELFSRCFETEEQERRMAGFLKKERNNRS